MQNQILPFNFNVLKDGSTYKANLINGAEETIPLDEIDHGWRQAVSSFFPMAWFAKRKVTRLLQTYASSGVANPATDIAGIRSVRDQLAIVAASPLAEQTPHWDATDTDTGKIDAQLTKAGELRSAIVAAGKLLGSTNDISKAVHPHINGKNIESPRRSGSPA